MIFNLIVFGLPALIVLVVIGLVLHKRVPRKLKPDNFNGKWKSLQQLCKDRTTWPQALIDADRLLNEALKKRRFKGTSMGERLVSAQRTLSNNDAVWFAHNLYKKIIDDEAIRLSEADVKQALVGIRQALKDLGALNDEKQP